MRILVNASNIYVGGGAQVSLSFIYHLQQFTKHKFFVLASQKIADQLNINELTDNIEVKTINHGFSDELKRKSKIMQGFEADFNPDVVFTIFGPSYWTPKAPHLMGFAMPWLINPDSKAFKELSPKMWIKKNMQNIIKFYFTKKNAKHFVVETEDVKQRLKKYFNVPLPNTLVADNTYNHHFKDVEVSPTRNSEFFELITITANYPHKNLKIINNVIPILKERGLKVRFTLTIPNEDFQNTFGSESAFLRNVGPVNSKDCPHWYNKSDALFLPTLLECFTASYPEAMIMKRPILTSDLPFAKQICKEGNALFFDPLNPENIADQIEKLVKYESLYNQLVENGLTRVKEFMTSKQRAEAYISFLEELANKS